MSQAELSASRRIVVRYGLISSDPANDGSAKGVASPSRNTTPAATRAAARAPRSAASPTTAAPLECPTRTGASEPVSPFAVRNAISWSARCLASNGALVRLYPVPVRSMANTRWSVPSAAPRGANVSAVSKAPGTRTTADPAVPQVRYRVSNPPALIMRRPAGRDAWPPVAKSYPKLAPVMAAARTTTTTTVRRATRRSRSATLAGGSPAVPVRDVRRGQRLSVLFRHDGPPGNKEGGADARVPVHSQPQRLNPPRLREAVVAGRKANWPSAEAGGACQRRWAIGPRLRDLRPYRRVTAVRML